MISVLIPIATVSVANEREHWRAKAKRTSTERFVVAAKVKEVLFATPPDKRPTAPFGITLTRISPGKLDGDNLASCLKVCRDAVADALGLANDRECDGLRWEYAQERRGKERAVLVEIRRRFNFAIENDKETEMASKKTEERAPEKKADAGKEAAEKAFRRLPVKLSEEERADRGRELAKATKRAGTLEAEKKNSADDYKGRIALVLGEASRLAEVCDSGIEFRDVEVTERRDNRRWEIQTIRTDTNELVGSRPMTKEERQESLPFEDPPGDGAKPKRARKAAEQTASV